MAEEMVALSVNIPESTIAMNSSVSYFVILKSLAVLNLCQSILPVSLLSDRHPSRERAGASSLAVMFRSLL